MAWCQANCAPSELFPGRGTALYWCCREQYAEMRDEFYAGLEDRKYLQLGDARKKASQVGRRGGG